MSSLASSTVALATGAPAKVTRPAMRRTGAPRWPNHDGTATPADGRRARSAPRRCRRRRATRCRVARASLRCVLAARCHMRAAKHARATPTRSQRRPSSSSSYSPRSRGCAATVIIDMTDRRRARKFRLGRILPWRQAGSSTARTRPPCITKLEYDNSSSDVKEELALRYAAASVEVTPMSRMFKALGDDVRLRIIALLSHGELCVCHIEEALDLTQTNTSRHLGILRAAGLVAHERRDKWVYYSARAAIGRGLPAPAEGARRVVLQEGPSSQGRRAPAQGARSRERANDHHHVRVHPQRRSLADGRGALQSLGESSEGRARSRRARNPASACIPRSSRSCAKRTSTSPTAKPQKLTAELAADAQWLVTMGCGDECPVVPGDASRRLAARRSEGQAARARARELGRSARRRRRSAHRGTGADLARVPVVVAARSTLRRGQQARVRRRDLTGHLRLSRLSKAAAAPDSQRSGRTSPVFAEARR